MKARILKSVRWAWRKLGPWLHRVLSENNGTPSSSRLLMYGWHLLVAIVWLTACIFQRDMIWREGVLAILGMVTGAKVINKFGESKDAPPDR